MRFTFSSSSSLRPLTWDETLSVLTTDPTSRLHHTPRDVIGLIRPYLWQQRSTDLSLGDNIYHTQQGGLMVPKECDESEEYRHYTYLTSSGGVRAHLLLPKKCILANQKSWECHVLLRDAKTLAINNTSIFIPPPTAGFTPVPSTIVDVTSFSLDSIDMSLQPTTQLPFFRDIYDRPLLVVCRGADGYYDVRQGGAERFAHRARSLCVHGTVCYYYQYLNVDKPYDCTLSAYDLITRNQTIITANSVTRFSSKIYGVYGPVDSPILILAAERGLVYYDIHTRSCITTFMFGENIDHRENPTGFSSTREVVAVHQQKFFVTAVSSPLLPTDPPGNSGIRIEVYRLSVLPQIEWSSVSLQAAPPETITTLWWPTVLLIEQGEVIIGFRESRQGVKTIIVWRDSTNPLAN